jgi:hypothetical protein
MPAQQQAVIVVRHPIEHPTHIQASMTFADTTQRTKSGTLQGTQSQHTKANLAKSLPCANAQPTHPG